MRKAELLAQMQAGWNEFDAYLHTLTEPQLTGPTDAAGWTVKDHIMHLAVWEAGVNALLQGESRPAAMGIPAEWLLNRDFDRINAALQQRDRDKPLADVRRQFREGHQRLIATVQALPEAALLRPYSAYQPDFPWDRPIADTVAANTYFHYAEHQPWIAAIAAGTVGGS